MEAYYGILVCCTNILGSLDPAALRRFAFTVGLKPLSEEGRLTLFRRYSPKWSPPSRRPNGWLGWTPSRRGTSRPC